MVSETREPQLTNPNSRTSTHEPQLTNLTHTQVKEFYESKWAQILVAMMIFANFVANAMQSEILPVPGSETDKIFGPVYVSARTHARARAHTHAFWSRR